MRNLVIGVCSFAFLCYLILIGFTVWGREKRSAELSSALNFAMEQAIENIQYNDGYSPRNDEELVAIFEQQFVSMLAADAEYAIEVLDVDAVKGLLSVRVKEIYRHLNGRKGSIQVQKTVFLEQGATQKIYGEKEIDYYLGQQLYRSYSVEAGDKVAVPHNPQMEGYLFGGWKEKETGIIYSREEIQEMTVEEDMEFIAVTCEEKVTNEKKEN